MTLGVKDKRTTALVAVLALFGGYKVYDLMTDGPPAQSATYRPPAAVVDSEASQTRPLESPGPKTQTRRAQVISASRASREEFVPIFREKRQGQGQETARLGFDNVDPTVHWELLAKVREVPPAGGTRNLFEASAAPPKPIEMAKAEPVVKPFLKYGPEPPKPPAPPPPPPPPPPIPLKLYGVVTMRNTGKRTACFIDGEDIVVASEGDIVKRRYRIVSIGAKLVTVEDIEAKRQQQLTLPEDGNS